MIDLVALQQFIDDGIPAVKEWDKTLFDIAGFPHYENVISNVYAWFLDPAESHGLGTLFIDSLQKLIGTEYEFDNPVVYREYGISGQQRIDLVVENCGENDTSRPTHALIIENKMFHHLHNNLNDYYNHFEIADSNKQGVLLTIAPQNPNHEQFVNITHQQWLQEVWSNISPTTGRKGNPLLHLPEDTLYHLKQFTRNLNNYAMHQQAKEHFTFYQKNQKEIKKVIELKKTLEEHIFQQIKLVPELITALPLTSDQRRSRIQAYYMEAGYPNIYYTIYPYIMGDDQPRVEIIIEVSLEEAERLLKERPPELEEKYNHLIKKEQYRWAGGLYLHYAKKNLKVTNDNIESLGQAITDEINQEDFMDIYTITRDFLYPSNPTNT